MVLASCLVFARTLDTSYLQNWSPSESHQIILIRISVDVAEILADLAGGGPHIRQLDTAHFGKRIINGLARRVSCPGIKKEEGCETVKSGFKSFLICSA